jgi:predicted ABC-type ATPase
MTTPSKRIAIFAGPNGAGRVMLQEIEYSVRNGESFAFETTLAGLGYLVNLFFLSLPTAEALILRVAERVKQGGHYISEMVIRRRFASGMNPKLLRWGEVK